MSASYYRQYTAALLIGLTMLTSCSKDHDNTAIPSEPFVKVRLTFNIDQVPLAFSQITFQNAAGNVYSVERLQFYLSRFEFIRQDGSKAVSDDIVYVDARTGTNTEFSLKGITPGDYASMNLCIGIDSVHNKTNALPSTIENVNMAWPDMMGGGYHFMKLEGNYTDGGNSYGFAMHLGKNAHLVVADVNRNIHITGNETIVDLKMNLNEWFRNPSVYDFNTDGNYSMSNDAAMLKLAGNGTDIFHE